MEHGAVNDSTGRVFLGGKPKIHIFLKSTYYNFQFKIEIYFLFMSNLINK